MAASFLSPPRLAKPYSKAEEDDEIGIMTGSSDGLLSIGTATTGVEAAAVLLLLLLLLLSALLLAGPLGRCAKSTGRDGCCRFAGVGGGGGGGGGGSE